MKYGYVGTPVKWDAALTTIVSGALASAEKKKEEDRKAVLSIVTGEIIRLAALKTAPQLGKPNMSDKLLEAVRSYYCSDSAKWKKYTPKTTLYMGFSETPKNLDLKPVDELITKKGALGQPLGVVIPSWPSEVSSE